jgi:hypothetical protein
VEYCPSSISAYYRDEDGTASAIRDSCSPRAFVPWLRRRPGDCDAHPRVRPLRRARGVGRIDNGCPGDPGYGSIDEVDDSAVFGADKIRSRGPLGSATAYQVARAGSPDFTSCTCAATVSTWIDDTEIPAAGAAFYYLVRSPRLTPELGRSSARQEELPLCP